VSLVKKSCGFEVLAHFRQKGAVQSGFEGGEMQFDLSSLHANGGYRAMTAHQPIRLPVPSVRWIGYFYGTLKAATQAGDYSHRNFNPFAVC
jgi:hypothetical protein